MSSTSRISSLPSAMRAVSAAASGSAALATRMGARQMVRRPACAAVQSRGYADAGNKAQEKASKSGDLPWILAAGGVTLGGLWFVMSTGGTKKDGQKTHEQHYDEIRKPTPSEPQGNGAGGDSKTKHTSSQTGQAVPPAPADKSTGSENYEDRKEAHEDYKEMTKNKDTKVATSSSEMPSKKTATENPKEDPKGGEGEGAQKGGSN